MEDDEDLQTKKRRLTDNDSEEGKRHAQSLYVGENVTTCTVLRWRASLCPLNTLRGFSTMSTADRL